MQRNTERVSNLIFDFLRAAAGPIGIDDDLVFGEIGDGVDRHAFKRDEAPSAQAEKSADDDEAVVQRPGDDTVDHGRCGLFDFIATREHGGSEERIAQFVGSRKPATMAEDRCHRAFINMQPFAVMQM